MSEGRKFDIRISERQRIILRNALVREITAGANPKVPEEYTEDARELHAMLVDESCLEPLVDPDSNHIDNTLNDFTA